MKLVKIFLAICLPFVNCNLFTDTTTALSIPTSPLFYVSALITDWNRKHSETGNIVIFNAGNKNAMSENLAKVFPKGNPVVILDPKQCPLIETYNTPFVIITSDDFTMVWIDFV